MFLATHFFVFASATWFSADGTPTYFSDNQNPCSDWSSNNRIYICCVTRFISRSRLIKRVDRSAIIIHIYENLRSPELLRMNSVCNIALTVRATRMLYVHYFFPLTARGGGKQLLQRCGLRPCATQPGPELPCGARGYERRGKKK